MSETPGQPPLQANSGRQDGVTEKLRIDRSFQVSILGLALAALLIAFLLFTGRTASDITSVVGLFTTILGTLIGTFFGLQIGAAGKDRAEERAEGAQKRADALQAAADQGTIDRARQFYPDLFK